jgi:hypothetical protein
MVRDDLRYMAWDVSCWIQCDIWKTAFQYNCKSDCLEIQNKITWI